MRKAELKSLFIKLTEYVGKKISYLTSVEGWTMKELSETTGITHTRLTEIKKFSKYQRAINESYLAAFLGEKLITVEELMEKANLNENEKEYIQKMKFYEDHDLRKKIQQAEDMGINIMQILDDAMKKNNE